jgi:hypothetical protein
MKNQDSHTSSFPETQLLLQQPQTPSRYPLRPILLWEMEMLPKGAALRLHRRPCTNVISTPYSMQGEYPHIKQQTQAVVALFQNVPLFVLLTRVAVT